MKQLVDFGTPPARIDLEAITEESISPARVTVHVGRVA
jgi:hypothetical protein